MKRDEFDELMAEESPCDKCRAWAYCKRSSMACDQFSMYVNGADQRAWRTKAKAPSHAIFLRVFSDDSCNWRAA